MVFLLITFAPYHHRASSSLVKDTVEMVKWLCYLTGEVYIFAAFARLRGKLVNGIMLKLFFHVAAALMKCLTPFMRHTSAKQSLDAQSLASTSLQYLMAWWNFLVAVFSFD